MRVMELGGAGCGPEPTCHGFDPRVSQQQQFVAAPHRSTLPIRSLRQTRGSRNWSDIRGNRTKGRASIERLCSAHARAWRCC